MKARDKRDEDVDGFLKPWLPPGLPGDAIEGELAYRTVAAKYRELLSLKRQLEAELSDGPSPARRVEIGNKITTADGKLGSLRTLVRDAGELSYATVFLRVANDLMSREAFRAIDQEVRALMKRPRHEVRSKGKDGRYDRLKGFTANHQELVG